MTWKRTNPIKHIRNRRTHRRQWTNRISWLFFMPRNKMRSRIGMIILNFLLIYRFRFTRETVHRVRTAKKRAGNNELFIVFPGFSFQFLCYLHLSPKIVTDVDSIRSSLFKVQTILSAVSFQYLSTCRHKSLKNTWNQGKEGSFLLSLFCGFDNNNNFTSITKLFRM